MKQSLFTSANVLNSVNTATPWQTWGIGLLIVTLTAFSAPASLVLLPLLSKEVYECIMTVLVGLGVGALSGSILLIMLPKAFNVFDDQNYMLKSAIILSAIYIFFFIDRLLQYAIELRKHHKSRKIRTRTLNFLTTQRSTDRRSILSIPGIKYEDETLEDLDVIKTELQITNITNAIARKLSTRSKIPIIQEISDTMKVVRSRLHSTLSNVAANENVNVAIDIIEKITVDPKDLEIANFAYMIIFGSSANNFVDGMSNGVAFGHSLMEGLSVGLACLAQQFPQELGMLAILSETGLGIKRAILLNLIPAITSYCGFILGVALGRSLDGASEFVFAVSSGMYLYIFLGTLIPEMRESINQLIKTDLRKSLLMTILHTIGMSVGIAFMFIMAIFGKIQM